MFSREKEWLSSPDVIDDLQGAGKTNVQICIHGTTRSYSSKCREGSICIRGLLRYQKAFDTVWVPGLLYKLHKAGIIGKIWRLINQSYQGFQCAAFIAGEVGEWFHTKRGVHQGAPLSMKLYQISINDILQDLRASIYGVE